MRNRYPANRFPVKAASKERLSDIREMLIASANAPARETVSSYMRRWKQWAAFAQFHSIADLPADPDHVSAFVVARLDADVSVGTIESNLTAIRWVHRHTSHDSEVTKGARRTLKVYQKNDNRYSNPATMPAAVLSVGAVIGLANWVPATDIIHSIKVIRLFTGLKPNQLLPLTVDDVKFSSDGNSVTLRLSTGHVLLDRGRHPLECPVRAMRSLVHNAIDGQVFSQARLYKASPRGFDPFDKTTSSHVRIGIRNRAIVLCGYAGALRVAEMSRLRIEDIRDEPYGYRLGIRHAKSAKPGEMQYVRIDRTNDELDPVQAIDEWLATRGDQDGPLFTPIGHTARQKADNDHAGLGASKIYKIVADRDLALRLNIDLSGHSLRRSWATHQHLRQPNSLGAISVKLRHSRLTTTAKYIEDFRLDPEFDPQRLLSPTEVFAIGDQKPDMRTAKGFKDTPLTELLEMVETLRSQPIHLPSTVQNHAIGWSHWCRFAIENDVAVMPANPAHVAAFISERAGKGRAHMTLIHDLSAIKKAHIEHGLYPADGFELAR